MHVALGPGRLAGPTCPALAILSVLLHDQSSTGRWWMSRSVTSTMLLVAQFRGVNSVLWAPGPGTQNPAGAYWPFRNPTA